MTYIKTQNGEIKIQETFFFVHSLKNNHISAQYILHLIKVQIPFRRVYYV